LSLQAAPGSPTTGKVVRTSWSLEPGSRTLRTEVDLVNPEGKVRPGMYVNARIAVDLATEWSLPAAAVGKVGEESVVYLVKDGKAIRTAVDLGRGDGQFTQVRRIKRPGASEWTVLSAEDEFASPAASLVDGQKMKN
jgi:multidrug efflux pump subunit AcrA (membrane-fusion protein)